MFRIAQGTGLANARNHLAHLVGRGREAKGEDDRHQHRHRERARKIANKHEPPIAQNTAHRDTGAFVNERQGR